MKVQAIGGGINTNAEGKFEVKPLTIKFDNEATRLVLSAAMRVGQTPANYVRDALESVLKCHGILDEK